MVMDSIENKPVEKQAVETKSAVMADANVSEPAKIDVASGNSNLASEASGSKGASNSGDASSDATSVVETGEEEKKLLISGLFTEGYRLYVAGEYQEASQKLGEATRLSVELYGQFAPQCCQPFLQYGRCLVEIAREEAVILANAKEDEEEESSNEEEVDGADETKPESIPAGKGNKPSGEPEPDEETLDNEEAADSTEGLAWECLETARNICEKQEETEEWLEKKATVLVALGDCLGVDDCFDQALKEFHTALAIQKKVYEPHDRRIAETYFHIGRMLVNLGAMNNPEKLEEAASAYDEAAKVLGMKIAHLESRSTSRDPEQIGHDIEEILNLKKVVTEVIDSAKDARESAVSARDKMEAQRAMMKSAMSTILNVVAGSADGQQSTSTEARPIVDISGQLRRREPLKRPAAATDASGTEKAGELDEAKAVSDDTKSEGAKKPRLDDESKKAE